MFRPHGVIFRIIKYGIIQRTSVVTTYGIPCCVRRTINNELLYWHNGMENPQFSSEFGGKAPHFLKLGQMIRQLHMQTIPVTVNKTVLK